MSRRRSIQRKLTAINLISTVSALVVATAGFLVWDLMEYRSSLISDLTTQATIIGRQSVAALRFDDSNAAREMLAALAEKSNIELVAVYDAKGKKFAMYARRPEDRDSFPVVPGIERVQFLPGRLELFHDVPYGVGRIGSVYLNANLDAWNERVSRYIQLVAVLALAASLIAFLLTARLQRGITEPIRTLVRAMIDISLHKDFTIRVPRQSTDELAALTDGFNTMLGEIETRDEALTAANAQLEDRVRERTVKLEEQIDERLRIEAALRRSEVQTRTIVDTALEAIVTIDTEGRIIDWNAQAERTFGFSRREAIGKTLADTIIPKRLAAAHVNGLARLNETGTSTILNKRIEQVAVRKNGEEFPIELTITKADLGDRVVYSGFIRDITGRKRAEAAIETARRELEEALRHATSLAEAAQAASRAKSEFLANMSHEIRTPLNAVIGMSRLLVETPLDPEQTEFAETIYSSAETLLNTINDVLDFSKIEAGKMTAEVVEFELRSVVEGVAEMLAINAHEKGLELVCLVPADLPESLLGDPVKIRQVLLNLISNALKFTERGEVRVDASVLSETGDRAMVQLAVADTGIGIPEDRLHSIFESFTQVDGSTSRKYGGTGLGLAICKQLAQLMGGELSAESRLGSGSTFTLQIPLMRSRKPGARPEDSSQLAQAWALVVTKNESLRRSLGEQLTYLRIANDQSDSIANAAKRVAAAPPDSTPVVLLDSALAPRNLEIAVRKLGCGLRRGDPRVVQILNSTARPSAEEARQNRIAAVVQRPCSTSVLRGALIRALQPGQEMPHAHPASEGSKDLEAALAGRRVLVVEDNPVNQRVALRILERYGVAAKLVDNGQDAVEAALSAEFEIVLMDVQMPGMDGYEATGRIRRGEAQSGRRVPIVAMTANATPQDRGRCLAAGMDDYLPKPVRPATLAETLARWLAREPAAPLRKEAPGAGSRRAEDKRGRRKRAA